MRPHLYAIDGIFPQAEFDMLQEYAHVLQYGDIKAPFDGVTYHNVAPAPPFVVEHLTHVLTLLMGYRVVPLHTCFRLSVEGSEPPQWAHSDAEVAKFGFFMFINPGRGGTALLEHKESGMRTHPQSQYELDLWNRDHNDESAWNVVSLIDSQVNRGILLRSDLIHAALPRRGYGESAVDGRLILLCFFD